MTTHALGGTKPSPATRRLIDLPVGKSRFVGGRREAVRARLEVVRRYVGKAHFTLEDREGGCIVTRTG